MKTRLVLQLVLMKKMTCLSGNLVFAIMACQIKWLHITMFHVPAVTFNSVSLDLLYDDVCFACYHLGVEMKRGKIVNEFRYLMLNILSHMLYVPVVHVRQCAILCFNNCMKCQTYHIPVRL